MRVRIFYQDFEHNAMVVEKENLVVFPIRATFIAELSSEKIADRWSVVPIVQYGDFAGVIWELMNLHPHETIGEENLRRFAKVGHTSMSVGDYIEWLDGTIWIAAPCGWKITTRCEVCPAKNVCEKEFQNCKFCLANKNELGKKNE